MLFIYSENPFSHVNKVDKIEGKLYNEARKLYSERIHKVELYATENASFLGDFFLVFCFVRYQRVNIGFVKGNEPPLGGG